MNNTTLEKKIEETLKNLEGVKLSNKLKAVAIVEAITPLLYTEKKPVVKFPKPVNRNTQ